MNYEKTRKLLFEPDFLNAVSKVHEDFVYLDMNEYDFYLANEMSFYLSFQQWEVKFRNTATTRLFNGYMGPFALFVRERFTKWIMDDWSAFNKTLQGQTNISEQIRQFKEDTDNIINTIPHREHLSLVADTLIKALSRIQRSPDLQLVMANQNQNNGVAPLKWCGQLDTLYTLFFDLSNRKSKATGQYFLEANKEEIMAFIMANFVDREGYSITSTTSMKTYLDPSRKDKKATKDRFVLQYDYKEPEAR